MATQFFSLSHARDKTKKIKFYLAPTCWFWSRVRSLFNKVALAKSSFMIKVGGTPPFLALQHKFFSKAFKTPSSLFIPDRIGWKASREWGGGGQGINTKFYVCYVLCNFCPCLPLLLLFAIKKDIVQLSKKIPWSFKLLLLQSSRSVCKEIFTLLLISVSCGFQHLLGFQPSRSGRH